MKGEFSHSKMKNILKHISGKRASAKASVELNKDVTEYGESIAKKASEYASEDDRVTVRAEDIRKAIRDL